MGPKVCRVVRWLSAAAGVGGWLALVVLLTTWPEHLGAVVTSASLAAVGTMAALVVSVPMTPRSMWCLAYDCGWRDGRRAERLSAQPEPVGVVTRLPEPRASRAEFTSLVDL